MSLYHEAAQALSEPASGGTLKSRIFGRKGLKSPPAQVYALALETSKWSAVLKEVIEHSDLLRHERKLTPVLALLLVHDHLLAKSGIALPTSHGLRAGIERHKARIAAEFTRARLRRRAGSVAALKEAVAAEFRPDEGAAPRWVRVNLLKSDPETQLATTFRDFTRVVSVEEVLNGAAGPEATRQRRVCVDEHVPGLLAVTPGTDLSKTPAYASSEIILQDKASCFPACLLDPDPGAGDVIDACAAPGNKTTHLVAVLHSKRKLREAETGGRVTCEGSRVLAFERDPERAVTLERRTAAAGAGGIVRVRAGADFTKTDPGAPEYARVTSVLLDPSCSGSGMPGRDFLPELHLPEPPSAANASSLPHPRPTNKKKNHKLPPPPPPAPSPPKAAAAAAARALDLPTRLANLAHFQLGMLTHAFAFPAVRRVTYSTCSVHDEENERVAAAALASPVAWGRGWRVLRRDEQTTGLRAWPVRGSAEAAMDEELAEGCIRSFPGDGRGAMGFFVVGFVRDG